MQLSEGRMQRRCEAKLFSVMSHDVTRGKWHNLNHKRVSLNIRKFFLWCENDQGVAQVALKCGVSTVGDPQKPSGHDPGELDPL